MSSEQEIDAELLLDRLVSASNSEDVLNSLEGMMTVNPDLIVQNPDVLNALLQVYSNTYKNLNIEDGPSAVTQLYLHLIEHGHSGTVNTLLNEPEEGRLLETAIDVVSDSQMAAYTRILGLQLIRKLSRSKYCLNQLLSAPNGLHRLGDLLREPDMIRNEMLQLSMILSKFSSVAKIWMFSEVADVILSIVDAEGGLSGNLIVADCLNILKNMLGHDAALADLVFQSPIFIPYLSKLLDLRNGAEFRNPPKPPVSDDLDDLINKASQPIIIPKLKESEEIIIAQVFEILSVVLENDSVKRTIWKNYGSLGTLIWELGLITPPPQPPFPCAFPSIDLQCKALNTMARYFNDYEILNKHSGMDRLLYLVCTGGPSETLSDKMKISQSSLFVIRQSLTDVSSNEILMQGLAPPMEGDSQPPVVMKLLNTALENLNKEPPDVARKVFVAGSLSALGLFLTDEPHRSILYRVTAKDGESKLLNGILKTIETESDEFVVLYLLRFLGEWILEAPMIVQEVLKNANTILLELFKSDKPSVSGLAGMVIGLCMEYMGDDESLCGGWTRNSLLKVVSPISKLTNLLEAVKTNSKLPWRYCDSELNIWKEWYEKVVLVVRKRLVSQLTESGEQTETVDSSEVHSMQKLVAEQAEEIDKLRAQALSADRTIQAQAKELASWKQRVESTPTQLDEMLNEYTAKNSELDLTILKLQDEIRVKEQSHADDLKERDEKYSALEQRLAVAQNALEEAQDERASLLEDMEALSQAYTSLEEEYRRQSQSASTPTAESPQEERPHQRQGEESSQQQSGSTEVTTLRAENTRMRQDAKAADEWMSMAVERMDAMAVEATAYQEQISSLQAQLASTGDETALRLSEEIETRMSLESELATLLKALESEQTQRIELENYVESSKMEYENLAKSLQESNAECELLQERLSSLEKESVFTEGQYARDGREDSLKTTIKALQEEVNAVKAELKESLERELFEISSRDARIRELESISSENQDPSGLALENQQLREANEAAQDWMNKAVDHHRSLSEQVNVLTQANSDLSAEIEVLKQSSSALTGSAERQEELDNKDREIQDLRDEVARCQEAVETYRAQIDTVTEVEKMLKKKNAEFDDLHALYVVKDQEIELLRSQVASASLTDSMESLQAEMIEKERKVESLQAEVVSLQSEVDELRTRENEALQRIADLEATRIEVGTTKEELEQLRARAAEAEGRQASIEKILEVVAQEKEELASEAQKNRDALEKIEKELTELRSVDLDTSHGSDWRESMKETVEILESQLAHQQEEATSVIEQWKETYEALQLQHAEADQKLQQAVSDKNDIAEELARATSEIDDLREQLASSHCLLNETEDLKKLVDNLKEQVSDQEKDSNETIQQWQDSFNEVQANLDSVIAEKNNLARQLEEAWELDKSVRSLEEQLANSNELARQWKDRHDALEREIGIKDNESTVHRPMLDAANTDLSDRVLEEKDARIEELERRLTELQKRQDADNQEGDVASRDALLDQDLQAVITNLKEQLADQAEESRQTIAEWEACYSELQDQLTAAQEKLKADPGTNQADESSPSVIELQEQLAQQEIDTNKLISQWQQSYDDMSAHLKELTVEKASLLVELQHFRQQDGSQSEPSPDSDQLCDANRQLETLQDQLTQQETNANNVVAQWQESYDSVVSQLEALTDEKTSLVEELQETREKLQHYTEGLSKLGPDYDSQAHKVKMLQDQLAEQDKYASMIVSEWQERYDEIVLQLEATTEEKASLLAELEETRETLEKGLESPSQNNLADIDSRVQVLQDQLAEQEKQATTIVSEWEESYNDIAAQLELLLEEKAELMKTLESFTSSISSTENVRPSDSDDNALAELQKKYEDAISELEATKAEKLTLLEELQAVDEPKDSSADEQLQALYDQLSEASSAITQWQQRYEEVNTELSALKKMVQENERLGIDPATLDSSQRSNAEEQVEDLQSRLAEQEHDAAQLLAQWEESYNEVLAQLDSLEQEQLKPLREQLVAQENNAAEAFNKLKASYDDVVGQLSRVTEQNESLLKELEEVREDQSELMNSLKEKVAILEQQLADQEAEVRLAIGAWEDRCKGMEQELAAQQEEAEEAVAKWDSSYTKLQADNEELSHELEQVQHEFQITSEELKRARTTKSPDDTQGFDTDAVVEDLERKLDSLKFECEAQEAEVKKLKVQVANKDEVIQELRRGADAAKSASSSVHLDAANKRIEELMDERYDLQCELNEMRTEKQRLNDQLDQVQESLRSELDQVKSASEIDLQTVNAELAVDREKIHNMETEIDDYRSRNASLEHKNEHLDGRVAELEDELREVDANLQLHLTNMVMAKGSDEAKEILMRQLEDTREKHHEDKRALLAERDARESAEAEVKRLRADLAAVLGMDDGHGDHGAVQQKLAEAKENFQRAERTEIEALKKSLSRALDELEDAREAEKEIQDRAAKAHHQAVLYEQEIINTKSDFRFLSQTVDEIRDTESSKRASLEYRISVLENEKSVQQRFHDAEIENLRNELSQVNMERDRLFQAVKESEKSKDALLQAKKTNVPMGNVSDPYSELAQLRIEKAQLLTAASEDAARIERRLRETRAAAKASSDTDVILEKELRMSAEKSLESAMLELHQLRAEKAQMISNAPQTAESNETVAALEEQLADSKAEVARLSNEYELIVDEMAKQERETASQIERLKDECRQAKARLSHLERDGRYEAEVRTEMERLRTSTTPDGVLVSLHREEDESDSENDVAVAKLYDVIDKQKQAIKEERVVYFNLVKEHDDLLALLAQENLIKESLSGALARVCGEAAVTSAMEEAENKAKEQYRKYVKLS